MEEEADRGLVGVAASAGAALVRVLPPEWEIDPEVMAGMSGGYRRVRDGARLQKHARIGVWVLAVGQWVVDRLEAADPPLVWADEVLPLAP